MEPPRRIPLFEEVPQTILDEWMADTSNAYRFYKAHECVVRQGTPCRSLHLLMEGTLRATMTNADGREVTIEELSAPAVLAPAFLFGSETRFPVNLTALADSRVWLVSKDCLLRFMREQPSVMTRFIAEISDRCVFLSKKLNAFALQDLRNRVIGYLKTYGRIANQQQVASVLGVARPSLARVLAELQRENIVRRTGNETVLVV